MPRLSLASSAGQRRYAVAAALIGWLLGLAFAALTIVRGFAWLAPMAACLALGSAPLAAMLVRRRYALRRALAEAPPRRYRLPTGAAEQQCPAEVVDGEGRTAVSVRLESARGLERLSDWTTLGDMGEPSRGLLRLRYPGLTALPCVPAVFVERGDRTLGLAWSGPDRVIVAGFPAAQRDVAQGDDEWTAALGAAASADARRAADLAAAGRLDVLPAQPASGILAEAGYELVGVVPLTVLSDYVSLFELEFAWPAGSEFAVELFEAETSPVAALHAHGTHADGGECDVVLVRVADDMFHAYMRREGAAQP